jgi:hypothetical protein
MAQSLAASHSSPCGFRFSRSSRASTFRSTVRLCSETPHLDTFFALPQGHDYVGNPSCLYYRQKWLGFERGRIPPLGPMARNLGKVRVHSPLGNVSGLARHLILSALAVPA